MKTQILSLAFLTLFNLTHVTPLAADDDPREAAWKAFERRQAEAETWEVSWTKKTVISGQMLVPPGEQAAEMPETVVSAPVEARLILSGDRVRYEHVGLSLTGEEPKWVPMIHAFDGSRLQSFSRNEEGGFVGHGGIRPADSYDSWRMVHNLGLFLLFRPLRPEILGSSPKEWDIEDRAANVDGHACVVLAREANRGLNIDRVYLDPNRDYLPLRYTRHRSHKELPPGSMGGGQLGSLRSRSDLEYGAAESTSTALTAWKAVAFFGGGQTPTTQSINEVVEIKLGLPVPDETFTIDYPPGTDLAIAGKDRIREERLVVAENGERVPLRLTQAVETAGGTSRWPWLFAGAGIAVLVVALLIVWRRRTAAQQS